ncbi:MAG: hypothetical protein ACRCUT_06190, partial [Spirochaetota bacterium]
RFGGQENYGKNYDGCASERRRCADFAHLAVRCPLIDYFRTIGIKARTPYFLHRGAFAVCGAPGFFSENGFFFTAILLTEDAPLSRKVIALGHNAQVVELVDTQA